MPPSTLSLLLFLVAARHTPPPAEHSPVSATGLPVRVVHDLARLAMMPSIAVLGGGAAAAAAPHSMDASVVRSWSSSSRLETALDGGATAGGTPIQFGMAAAIYGVGL